MYTVHVLRYEKADVNFLVSESSTLLHERKDRYLVPVEGYIYFNLFTV
jgi:hypothetical protein